MAWDFKSACLNFSTGDQKSDDGKSFWTKKISTFLPVLHFDFHQHGNFSASATIAPLGSAVLLSKHVDPHTVIRAKNLIIRDHIDDFCLLYIVYGAAVISCNNGATTIGLKPGQWILKNSAVEYLLRFESETEAKVLILPKSWLASRTPCAEEMALKDVCDNNGWGRALACVMAELNPETVHQLPLPPGEIVNQISALLTLTAGWQEAPALRTGPRATLRRLRQAMRDRLHDPALTPSDFAAQQGISKRTLHALFAAAGTSFSKDLISMRLEYARSLLTTPGFQNKSIAEISRYAGFTNSGHFSRRFLAAYGVAPSIYSRARQRP